MFSCDVKPCAHAIRAHIFAMVKKKESTDLWIRYRALMGRLDLRFLPKHHAMGHALSMTA